MSSGSIARGYSLPAGHLDAPVRLDMRDSSAPIAIKVDDRFGAVLAFGDFNGNGCDDLAIGIPSYEGAGPFAGDDTGGGVL